MTVLRIIIAQLNFPVGDITGNTQKMIAATQQARDELKGDMIIFPELALSGYPPEDLLLRTDFHQQIQQALQAICAQTTGITVVLGYPEKTGAQLYNAVCVIENGNVILNYRKQYLPNFGVFDEMRYFNAGNQTGIFTHKGIRFGIIICQDLWHPEPIAIAAKAGAQIIICPNASPFETTKTQQRENVLQQRIAEQKLPIIYTNLICGQDDLIFDGGSLVMNAQQQICVQGDFFQEQLLPVDIDLNTQQPLATALPAPLTVEEKVYQGLVLAVREYVNRNKFPGVLIGVSGGIDSALVLAIAVDALGKDRVHGVVLPSRYTSELSMRLLNEIIKNFAVPTIGISIENSFQSFLDSLAPVFQDLPKDITEENLQARCRGVLMMALSNQTGNLVLTTGNKSEMAVGYATLYGDMAGGFAVIKDVYKTLVYRLARYRNSISPQIPQAIIDRPPTAELAPDQKDQDTLPPYDILDPILELYIEQDSSVASIIAQGFDENTVKKVIKLIHASEYKRRQAPPGPRVTSRALGRERRYPITLGFNYY